MPASRIASFTAAATFSTIAGRPMSSGSSTALIAVPITSRAFEAGPVLSLRAKTVACGVMTPSQPPDHTIGIWLTAFSSRLPCLSNMRRKAWSARMRVKSLTPPFPSVLPMTPMTASALNRPLVMPFSRPEASDTDFNSTLRTSIAIASCLTLARRIRRGCRAIPYPRPIVDFAIKRAQCIRSPLSFRSSTARRKWSAPADLSGRTCGIPRSCFRTQACRRAAH